MIFRKLTITLIGTLILSCNSTHQNSGSEDNYAEASIVGAMRDVMWKGDLGNKIELDTISNKKGLYGIGPASYLTGELLINGGKSYVSKVTSDSSMVVNATYKEAAPFFVYAYVNEWKEIELPAEVKTISGLEKFINQQTLEMKRPFAFKLVGTVSIAKIHIQNLPEGTKVASPEEAHQGQINYELKNEEAEIVGFFSTEHQGVFTHHDSYIHMHLITKDESKMGHLDELEIDKMTLYLPKS